MRVPPPPHSCRKQSSWRESVTGSIPRSPSTPSQTPPSSTLTSTRRPRVWARRPTGLSPRRLPASPSHPPRPPPRHLPRRAAAAGRCLGSRRAGESRWSRKSRVLSTRALIQRMVLISAWPKMNRLRQIKPLQQQQQQHRVRLLTGVYFIVLSTCCCSFCPNILFPNTLDKQHRNVYFFFVYFKHFTSLELCVHSGLVSLPIRTSRATVNMLSMYDKSLPLDILCNFIHRKESSQNQRLLPQTFGTTFSTTMAHSLRKLVEYEEQG